MMISKSIKSVLFAVGLAVVASPVMAQEGDTAESQVANMFDSSSWMQGGQSAPGGGWGGMFAAPTQIPQFNLATPNGWSVFMNPMTYAQMMNPATYAQMMNPAFYLQYMNPQNWLSWFDPNAYSNWLKPETYVQAINPLSYLPYMNPLTYMAPLNPSNYGPYLNPQTYTQWFNPAAYNFSGPNAPQSQAGQNWFNPETWTKQLETSE